MAIDAPLIDWSGNCGNLSAAVGPFAIAEGLVEAPRDGIATVRIWQANLRKRILAHVPMQSGLVQEEGDFELDGVTFPAAEVGLEFLDPGAEGDASGAGGMFPTGRILDTLETADGAFEVTLLNAGNPMVFADALAFGLQGTESQDEVNGDAALLARCERLRAQAAVAMGIARNTEEATQVRRHTPKLIFVAPPAAFATSRGHRQGRHEPQRAQAHGRIRARAGEREGRNVSLNLPRRRRRIQTPRHRRNDGRGAAPTDRRAFR